MSYYDYEDDPYSEEPRYYGQEHQQYYDDHYEPPQDPSGHYSGPRTIPQDPTVLEHQTSTWNSSDQSFRQDRPHYTHASTWSGDTHVQSGGPAETRYDGGHRQDFGYAGQHSRSGRPHSQTHPMYAPPVAQSTNSRASYSAPRTNPNHGRSGYLSTQNILDPRYVVQPSSYYEIGKVFAVLWHENDGRGTGTGTVASKGPQYIGRFGQPIYSTIRRMVAIRVLDQCSWCIAINTYNGQGVAKPGIDESKHAIVHFKDDIPMANDDEPPMVKEPLAVTPDKQGDKLDEMSRLNFGKIYTVEHNVKVKPIGTISRGSMTRFRQYARDEMMREGP